MPITNYELREMQNAKERKEENKGTRRRADSHRTQMKTEELITNYECYELRKMQDAKEPSGMGITK